MSCREFFFSLSFLFILTSPVLSQTAKPVSGKNGMVVSAHRFASETGIRILKSGGNAIDAAVAVAFALQSVYPTAGNIGGGGFAVIRLKDGSSFTLDFRETAPAGAAPDMYIRNGKADGNLSKTGILSAGVPGTVGGMAALHDRWGRLAWKTVVQPSVRLAEFHVLTSTSASVLNDFSRELGQFRETAEIYCKPDGTAWAAGDTFRQPDLARTLQRIALNGPGEFYSGETAALIAGTSANYNGLLSAQDLVSYKPVWREPLTGTYQGIRLLTMGLPSSGGVILLQTLNMLALLPDRNLDLSGPESIHDVCRSLQLAYADRAAFMGDPAFTRVPLDTLISPAYAARRLKETSREAKIPSANISQGMIAGYESDETTHFSIVDGEGNAISITYTLNGAFGSFLVVKGAGFLLNNEMDDFSIQPGVPNLYGLIGGKANDIRPGKRMLSSMTPVIAEKNGKLWLVAGSPGGSTIPTTVLQTFLHLVHSGKPIHEAVSAGRFHYQWLPDIFFYERNFLPAETLDRLRSLGYHLEERKGYQGRCDAILIDTGGFHGGADPRGEDTAIGF